MCTHPRLCAHPAASEAACADGLRPPPAAPGACTTTAAPCCLPPNFSYASLSFVLAQVVGNHDCDLGPDSLANYTLNTAFPVLGANINASAHPVLGQTLQPYTIITLEDSGLRVGVVGFATETTAFTSSCGGCSIVYSLLFMRACCEGMGGVSHGDRGIHQLLRWVQRLFFTLLGLFSGSRQLVRWLHVVAFACERLRASMGASMLCRCVCPALGAGGRAQFLVGLSCCSFLC